jgi:hypothetical protein
MRGMKRDWRGVTQHRLTVVSELPDRDRLGNVQWECLCECGKTCVKTNHELQKGAKSCSAACGVSRSNTERAIHGMYDSKEYKAWKGMRQRCLNPNHTKFHRYGGRGIPICDAWKDSFLQFLADVGLAPEGVLTIDRIENEKGYEPGNVKWSTRKEQSNNREVTIRTELNGETLPLSGIAEKYGLPRYLVYQRFKRGLRGQELITAQKVGRKKK